MEVHFGPNAVDESNLLYKLQRKVKVFQTSDSLANRGYNLISSSTKYGVVFVAAPQGILSVYNIKDLIDDEKEPRFLSIKLQVRATHIAVNCDHEWLAIVGGQTLLAYKVSDFQNPNVSPSVSISCEVNPSTFLSALQWNPCVPDTIGLVFFDGTLVVCQVNNMQKKQIQSSARCLSWSPKGKQLVTGNADGTLCQFKPDLTPMKSVPAPNLFEGAPVEALAIYWISTYQFAVVFRNASDNSRPAVTIVNTPKGGTPTCLNFEDICYSMGSNRPWYYYLQGLAQWNLIMTSSSNSMEIATLASKDGSNWIQWCQNDEARPELPLTDKKEENYPVGICIDTCAAHQLPWGENEVLPPMPFLLVVSHTGLLTIYNIINLDKSAPQLCTPIQALTLPEASMTSEIPNDSPSQTPQPEATQPKPVQQAQPTQLPSFGQTPTSQPAFGQQAPTQPPFGQTQTSQPAFGQQKPTQPAFGQPTAQQVPTFGQQKTATPSFGQQATFAQQKLSFGQQSQPVVSGQVGQKSETKTTSQAPTTIEQKPSVPSAAVSNIKVEANISIQSEKSVAEANALKLEQEKLNKAKMDKELKNILVKEVNDFQQELYKFRVTTSENQIKIQQQIESLMPNMELHTMDAEKLKKGCGLEELRESVIQLKLELVRACAVVAEARTHAEAKELYEWTQADPLTTKRFESIKKLAYYVQNQLDQAQKELEYKWDEMISKSPEKPGQRMIRPFLDEVYQPLVKQNEILCRQQVVLRTLKKTLKECSTSPMFKTTSMLRSTPFKTKDPLSKLTKNILNMSIEAQQDNKDKELSSQKLDALRDMLSNHRPRKIKPVSIEVHKHLEEMRQKYEKAAKERADKREMEKQLLIQKEEQARIDAEKQEILKIQAQRQEQMKIKQEQEMKMEALKVEQKRIEAEKKKQMEIAQSQQKPAIHQPVAQNNTFIKPEPKSNIIKESPVASSLFAPNIKQAFGGVARTLFSAEAKSDMPKPQVLPQIKPIKPEANQRSMPNYSQGDADNLLQNICSPTSFATTKVTTTSSTTPVFSSKPIADMTNMFSKFAPAKDTKASVKPTATSEETGEVESPVKATDAQAKENKPLQNIFSLKPSAPFSSVQNVPDVLKGNQNVAKTETKPKSTDSDKPKELVPKIESKSKPLDSDKNKESITQSNEVKISDVKKEELKPFSIQSVSMPPNFSSAQPVFVVDLKKPNEIKIEKTLPSSFYTSTPTTSAPAKDIVSTSSTIVPDSPKETSTTKSISETKISPPIVVSSTTAESDKESKKDIIVAEPLPTVPKSEADAAISTTTTESSKEATAVPTSPSAKSVFSSASKSLFSSLPASEPSKPLFGSSTVSVSPSIQATTSAPAFRTSSNTASPTFSQITTAAQTQASTASTTSTSTFASSAQSVFSAANKTVFGTTTTQSIFGSNAQTPTFGGSAFSSGQSVFGASSTPSSVFGTAAQSAFGQTTQSGFGTTTTQSIFGTATTTTSLFGTPATSAATSSIFGSSTSGGSVFGASSSQPSVFGGTNAQPAFGSSSSIFGTPATTQSSVFGAATTTQSGSLFGDGGASLFASASISTTSAPSQSGGNIFGGSSGFGSSSTNVFGSNSSSSSGGLFQLKPATDFWSGGSNTSSGFGSSGFGQPTTQSSVFGSGSFSQTNTGQPFGSPQQSTVFGSPQQSAPAFGASPAFGSKPVFGSPPSFGGSAFGGMNKSPGFGSSASFGGGATFGGSAFGSTSPGKVFGGSSPTFASAAQSNSTFENLANQNTLTFGNLAQQSGQAPAPAPAFNASPSFTGWRG